MHEGRLYQKLIRGGLAGLIGFAVFARAAHDLWAASLVFLGTTLLSVIFCIGRFRDQEPIRLPLLFPFAACGAAILLSARHAYDLDAFKLEAWGWFFISLLFYLFLNTMENAEDLESFHKMSSWTLLPLAGLCLWEQWKGIPDGRWIPEIHATLINSIVLAGFALYWPIVLWDKIKRLGDRWGILFLSSVGILLIAKSWWSFVSLGVGYLFYYRNSLASWARRRKRAAVLASVLILSGFFLLVWLKLLPTGGDVYHSGQGRPHYWATALKAWRRHPWTGVGLGGFPTAFGFFKSARVQNTRFAHSFPLQWTSETGLMGLIAAAFLVLSCWRLLKRRPGDAFMAGSRGPSAYPATLAAVLFFSLINFNMEFFLNKCLLMMTLGSALTGGKTPHYRAKPLWMATAAIGLLLIVPLWAGLWTASRLYTAGLFLEQRGDRAGAKRNYESALSLNATHADSHRALSRIHWDAFQKSRSAQDLAAAQRSIARAFDYRKDPLFLNDLTTYNQATP